MPVWLAKQEMPTPSGHMGPVTILKLRKYLSQILKVDFPRVQINNLFAIHEIVFILSC